MNHDLPAIQDRNAAAIIAYMRRADANGRAVTRCELRCFAGPSSQEVDEALHLILHSTLPIVATTMQRNSTGLWTEHYQVLRPDMIRWAHGASNSVPHRVRGQG